MGGIDPQAPMIDAGGGLLLPVASGLPRDEPLLACGTNRLPSRTSFTVEDVAYAAWVYVTGVNGSRWRVHVEIEWLMEGGAARTAPRASRRSSRPAGSPPSTIRSSPRRRESSPQRPVARGADPHQPSTSHSASIWLTRTPRTWMRWCTAASWPAAW